MYQIYFVPANTVPAILYHSLSLQILQARRLTHMMRGILKVQILVPCWMSLWPRFCNRSTMISQLGMMPTISKSATVSQTNEWRANRRVQLYHSCINIISTKINELVGRDVYIKFADNMTRRSRVFLDFLCMDGDEVSTATMQHLPSE